MLETERHDREPDNDGPASAGDSAGVTRSPAEAGPNAAPQGTETGGAGRRLFRRGRRAASRPAGPPAGDPGGISPDEEDTGAAGATAAETSQRTAPSAPDGDPPPAAAGQAPGFTAAPTARSAPGFSSAPPAFSSARPGSGFASEPPAETAYESRAAQVPWRSSEAAPGQEPQQPPAAQEAPQPATFQPPVVIFQPPDLSSQQPSANLRSSSGGGRRAAPDAETDLADESSGASPSGTADQDDDAEAAGSPKRRRRGGRGHAKGRGGDDGADQAAEQGAGSAADDGGEPGRPDGRASAEPGGSAADGSAGGDGAAEDDGEGATGAGRRRRRRRRSGAASDAEAPASDDPPNTVVHVRPPRSASDDAADVRGVKGSTRLEAKRQRRREGRESGRRRPPIITESEFLARREAVERVMVVRQHAERTQIAVLEDGILVEHYVDKANHQSYVGNVYLGRVQNVLPSMEAAFVDIGKGRNAVLYAGEVNFDASGLEGESKRIESALKSGQSILVQATKDPIGHKGARLTSQVSLPGRYLVYVPGANMTGISRKLPDTERTRLKQILKQVMPENAGVIVRTAAEGATEEELAHDVARLAAQWEAIEKKAKSATAPELLYSEPDLTIRVVRDIFNEDFTKLVIASDGDWDMVDEYVRYVAPNLAERLERWTDDQGDVFAAYRIDEQIAKALERKVWLPSGGSLVIDTTEAMTVIDVNTGKFTGQGGNLEQTVTRNNLEAAEEIVRQLRVRDVGGIIVIDFIDMVLESNRDLVLRRLLECLARDRTKHQVAEVTSLGLVQMTRKRVGSGLLEAFSVPCECCNGRGVIVSLEPVDHAPAPDHHHGRDGSPRGGSGRGGRGGRGSSGGAPADGGEASPAAKAATPKPRPPTTANGNGEPGAAVAARPAGAGPADDAVAEGRGAGVTADAGEAGGAADGGTAGGGAAGGGAAAGGAAGTRRASGGRRRRRGDKAGESQGGVPAADAQHGTAATASAGEPSGDVQQGPAATASAGEPPAGAHDGPPARSDGGAEVRGEPAAGAHDGPGAPGPEADGSSHPDGSPHPDGPGRDTTQAQAAAG
jgi:ribonuclease E